MINQIFERYPRLKEMRRHYFADLYSAHRQVVREENMARKMNNKIKVMPRNMFAAEITESGGTIINEGGRRIVLIGERK